MAAAVRKRREKASGGEMRANPRRFLSHQPQQHTATFYASNWHRNGVIAGEIAPVTPARVSRSAPRQARVLAASPRGSCRGDEQPHGKIECCGVALVNRRLERLTRSLLAA